MKERLHEILKIALRHDVTDVHFTVTPDPEKPMVIGMRVRDVMRHVRSKPDDLKFLHYLMYRSNLDVADTLDPQTGSFSEEVEGRRIAMRFAYVHSGRMASGVLRILNAPSRLSIPDLSHDQEAIQWLSTITAHRNGFFVFSGPTGSGKTTSLYTILNAVEGKSIYTLEDPIEVYSENYVQIQINEKQHLSYADGIRQLMRHDPDIIMIGEIRDEEAARMAVRSALTGHLVVTSIHASSCTGALERLIDLGCEKGQLREVLGGISNQRLYTDVHGRKTGIYEIMDRKEVNHWFETGRCSKGHRTLAEKAEEAAALGQIDGQEAEADTFI
jgi:competence protein ComGA